VGAFTAMQSKSVMMTLCVAVLAGVGESASSSLRQQRSQVMSEDSPAADTLQDMVQWIESGKFANNFWFEGVLKSKPKNDKEEVGACLMDKVGAIDDSGIESLNEDKMPFANDLQVDLGACCTKDKDACLADLGGAYGLIAQFKSKTLPAAKANIQIACSLIRAVEKRVTKDRLKGEHSKRYGRVC